MVPSLKPHHIFIYLEFVTLMTKSGCMVSYKPETIMKAKQEILAVTALP